MEGSLSEYIIIIALVILSGVIYLWKIRSYDKYDPEPIWKLAVATIVGGAVSIVVALLMYEAIPYRTRTFLDMFLLVGPVEELSKFLAFLIVVYALKGGIKESGDGIIYMACAALGFSLIENVGYAAEGGYLLLALRTVVCVIGHMAFSIYMGLAYYIHVKRRKNYFGLLLAFIISAGAHGLYNTITMSYGLFVIPFWIGLAGYQLFVVRFALSKSEFRKEFSHALFKRQGGMVKSTCLHCGNQAMNYVYVYKEIEIINCDSCTASISRISSWEKMMAEFRPIIKWDEFVASNEIYARPKVAFNRQKTIVLDNRKQIVGYREAELIEWFKEGNMADQDRMLDGFGLGLILRLVGARYN